MRNIAAALSIMALMAMAVSAAQANSGNTQRGFDQFGYNYQARLFNGWYGQWYEHAIGDTSWDGSTYNASLVMKWSKDWTPQANEPVGSWVTNHFTWYSNDYNASTAYGWDTRVAWNSSSAPKATYQMEEFLKIQKVADNATLWNQYNASGAYDAGWGNYADGVPEYVVFQDVIDVYQSGNLTAEINVVNASPKGLGKPIFG